MTRRVEREGHLELSGAAANLIPHVQSDARCSTQTVAPPARSATPRSSRTSPAPPDTSGSRRMPWGSTRPSIVTGSNLRLTGGRGFENLTLIVGFERQHRGREPRRRRRPRLRRLGSNGRPGTERSAPFAQAVWQRIDTGDAIRQVFVACAVPEAENKLYVLEPDATRSTCRQACRMCSSRPRSLSRSGFSTWICRLLFRRKRGKSWIQCITKSR